MEFLIWVAILLACGAVGIAIVLLLGITSGVVGILIGAVCVIASFVITEMVR